MAVYNGVPGFFRACCHDAANQVFGLHSVGYAHPGRELMRNWERVVPDELEEDEWLSEVEHFTELLLTDQDDAALNWLREHWPACLKLVPSRRRMTFLQGLREAAAELAGS